LRQGQITEHRRLFLIVATHTYAIKQIKAVCSNHQQAKSFSASCEAPEGCFSGSSFKSMPFSAACLAPEGMPLQNWPIPTDRTAHAESIIRVSIESGTCGFPPIAARPHSVENRNHCDGCVRRSVCPNRRPNPKSW
jgi:hypothetical protein